MDSRKTTGKVIDPVNFTPLTIQGILPKEFALELVRRYKEVIATWRKTDDEFRPDDEGDDVRFLRQRLPQRVERH